MDAFGAGYLPDLRALQSGLLDWLKDLYCSLPASGVSLSGRGYDGLGGGGVFDFAFDPQSGRLGGSGGIDVGVGYGGEVKWSGGTSGTIGRSVPNGCRGVSELMQTLG